MIVRVKLLKSINSWKKKTKKSKHRYLILRQWIATEQSYIKDLHTIIEKVHTPMKENKLIDAQQQKILFPNLSAMLQLSQQLLNTIKQAYKYWDPLKTMIGQSVSHFHKFFMIYRQYCNNFYRGQLIIQQIRKNKPEQLKKIESKLQMDLQSFIIKPVQRPPKYQLLLRQYLKVLPKYHNDYEFLEMAVDKYHEVNQANNQSMQKQMKGKVMVQLDHRFKHIISNTAQRKFQEQIQAFASQFTCKLYIFNDLILVTKLFGKQHEIEQQQMRLYLNGISFVEKPMDGKYFVNRLFVCDSKGNCLHLGFPKIQERDYIYSMVNQNIIDLYEKQTQRKSIQQDIKQARRQSSQNGRISIFSEQFKQENLGEINGCRLKINVVGVEKRPINALTTNTFYIVKIQALYPYHLFQFVYLEFEKLLEIEIQIRSQFQKHNIPILDYRPSTMNYYEIKKNKTKIIEIRSMQIQKFLNYIFRTISSLFILNIIKKIGINLQFWQFLTKQSQQCICQQCHNLLSFNKNIFDINQYKNDLLKTTKYRQSIKNKFNTNPNNVIKQCSLQVFKKIKIISQINPKQFETHQKRLLYLDCTMGRMSSLPIVNKLPPSESTSLRIYFITLRQQESIQVTIDHNTLVSQVLDEIAERYNLNSIRDYGLFMDYKQTSRLIDRDQLIWLVMIQMGLLIPKESEKQSRMNFFTQGISKLKKKAQQFMGVKMDKIYMKKYLFLSQNLEMQACQNNPQRCRFIVDQIFYNFKNQILILSLNNTKSLCALYYSITQLDQLTFLTNKNFQKIKLKKILPQTKWFLLNDKQNFQKQVLNLIISYRSFMKDLSKIQLLYKQVIILVSKSQGWNTHYFLVRNSDPPSLPGGLQSVFLGINRNSLTIIRPKTLGPLLEVSLHQLKYKVTAFSIFIETDVRMYRFDGQIMYDVKKLIEMYLCLTQKFDQNPKQKIINSESF